MMRVDVMMCMPPEGARSPEAVTRAYEKLYARNTDEKTYQVIHYFVLQEWKTPCDSERAPLLCTLGSAVSALSECDAVYFGHGWEKSYWCMKVERIAKACGIQVMEEDFE